MRTKILTAVAVLSSAGLIAHISFGDKKAESSATTSVAADPFKKQTKIATSIPAPAIAATADKGLELKTAQTKFWDEYKYKNELKTYAEIQAKALLQDDDKLNKRALLQDAEFIRSLEPLLLNVASRDDAVKLQNTAVDLLIEALKSSSRGEAIQVLKAVVADPAVEDAAQDLIARKSLAGVKAEVLFNWSSTEPGSEAEIENSLPGPVSQKIWKNVKYKQDNNLAESRALANSRSVASSAQGR